MSVIAFESVKSRLSLLATMAMGSLVQPRYAPPTVSPNGVRQAEKISAAYAAAVEDGYAGMRKLMKFGEMLPPAKDGSRLSVDDMANNVMEISTKLLDVLKHADPDGLAAKMVELLCIGVPGMDNLDNRRRVVSIWSAMLAPTVVVREKYGEAITIEHIVDCAADWVQFGYTEAAQRCNRSRDTKFICKHPARSYQLVADSAHAAGIDHDHLVASLIMPVLVSLGTHVGAVRAAHEPVKEAA